MTTSKQRISITETQHVARLSKLEFSEAELTELNQEMSAILDTVSKLDNVPIEGLEATLAVGAYANRFREDCVDECLERGAALQNAPNARDGCFEITRIISKIDE
jgi:aspartyl-tRNA(Asn)/glutamyl-tRNA(Gln) amidotransferase subunit C